MVNATHSLPTFSMIVETENLATADINGLIHSFASVVNQDVSPTQANEVILIDSGDTPIAVLSQLCDRYPWIKVHSAPPDTGYYKAKMLGARLVSGEIVVYADSDCIYEPHWLRTILESFANSEQIQIVAGETTTRGTGPYGTAMALTYIFPQFSGKTELMPTTQYFLNNVAFRREFLLQHPIPVDLPLYRGNCVVHVEHLKQAGHTIWLNPAARATHAPPNGLSHFFWRFLLIGHDFYWQKQIIAHTPHPIPYTPHPASLNDPTVSGLRAKLKVGRDRLQRLFINNPWHGLYFPFAIPIVLVSVILIYIGYWITRFQPNLLLKTYDRLSEAA